MKITNNCTPEKYNYNMQLWHIARSINFLRKGFKEDRRYKTMKESHRLRIASLAEELNNERKLTRHKSRVFLENQMYLMRAMMDYCELKEAYEALKKEHKATTKELKELKSHTEWLFNGLKAQEMKGDK